MLILYSCLGNSWEAFTTFLINDQPFGQPDERGWMTTLLLMSIVPTWTHASWRPKNREFILRAMAQLPQCTLWLAGVLSCFRMSSASSYTVPSFVIITLYSLFPCTIKINSAAPRQNACYFPLSSTGSWWVSGFVGSWVGWEIFGDSYTLLGLCWSHKWSVLPSLQPGANCIWSQGYFQDLAH